MRRRRPVTNASDAAAPRNSSKPGKLVRYATSTDHGNSEAARPAACAGIVRAARQRRLDGISQIALSLTARGLTTGEIAAHLAEVYGVRVSKDTIYRIIGKVMGQMARDTAKS
jgi:transposase-like protein